MNKRELVNYVVEQQTKSWEQPTDYEKRTKAYEHCKEICKQNGYTGGAFENIWLNAIRQRAITNGTYRG